MYLQNPPMNMKNFINFCKKRGIKIDKSNLEDLEKKKLFFPIFRVSNIYNPISEQFVAPSFSGRSHDELISYLNSGNIYIPQDNEFIEFEKFKDSETSSLKIYSYYSNFQIWPLIKILKDEKRGSYLNSNFDNLVNLLTAVQIYAPYGRSNLRRINLKTEKNYFYQKLEEFDLDEVLNLINLDSDDLYKAYAVICSKLRGLLGSDDLIQLWKNISWSKKDNCIGHTRLGVEYLQWAMMLKRCIEDYLHHEIFDVDEVNGDWEKVRDELPSNETGRTQRGVRNDRYTNRLNDEYEFRLNRKKLYYLANSLTLDYHPRVNIFVEGDTEEVMIPKFFELYGYNFWDSGFEIVNIEGITKYYSGNIEFQKSDEKIDKIIINNFRNLIMFNLNLWQVIPFFIGDNENDIGKKLKEGIIFDKKSLIQQFTNSSFRKVENEIIEEYGDVNDAMIEEWVHIWKYDFELDNFKSSELQVAINDVCRTDYSLEDIQKIYDACENGEKVGINSLGKRIKRNKIAINEKALENLVNYYEETNDEGIFERPIFKVIEKLFDIYDNNHQPVNTNHALKNREELNKNILLGRDIFSKN